MGNDLGLGILLTLKDLFSPKAKQVSSSMKGMKKDAEGTVESLNRMNTVLQGVAGAAIFSKSKELFTAMVSPALELEKAMAKVNSRIEGTDVNIEAVKGQLKTIAADFGVSSARQAAELTELLDGGFANVNDALKILPLSNKLAKASFVDLGVASKTLVDVFNSFKPAVEDMPQIANQLHILGKAGSGTFEFLASGLQRILPQAANLGIKFEDITALMMSMAENGVSQKNSVAAIGAVMDALSTDTEKLDAVMKKNGLTNTETALQSVGLSNVLVGLLNATKGNKDAWKELGFSGQALKSLFAGLDAEGQKLSSSMELLKTDGENMTRAYTKATDNMTDRWEKAKVAFENMKSTLGDKLLTQLAPVIEKMVEWGKKLSEFIDKHPKFATAVAIGIGVIAALGVALGAVAAIAAVLTVVLSPVGIVMLKIAAIVGLVIGAFFALKAAITSVLDANQDTVEKIKSAWTTVKAFVMDAWLVFTNDVLPILQMVGSAAWSIFNTQFIEPLLMVVNIVKTVYNWFQNINQAIRDFIGSFGFVQKTGEFLKGAFLNSIPGVQAVNLIKGRADQIRQQEQTQVASNTNLSTASNPGISAPAQSTTVSPIINVPPAKIVPAQVNLDKKKIGEIVFSMQQLSTVRAEQ